MVVIVVLSVLVIVVASLLVFAKINNQKNCDNQRKVEYFHGYPTTGVIYPKTKADSEKTIEELENEMLHLWVDGYIPNQKTQDDTLRYTSQYYASQHTPQ